MKYLNALNTIPGVGSGTIRKLLGFFQSPELIWRAGADELRRAGISENFSQKIAAARSGINPDNEWDTLVKEDIFMLSAHDEDYPALLKEIADPTFLIYMKGNVDCLALPAIAIVGSRKYTQYGKQVAQRFGYDLAKAGICVVSGLALGIDAFAHRGALDAHGKTIAVLGNSLECASIYPRNNSDLAKEIIDNGGLLISEYPIGTLGGPGLFPARNRIMAGMTLGTLVVEAAEKSGSLITANHALEFNRDVFAVPGPIFSPQSEGSNNLIKKGAKTVTNLSDILEELRIENASQHNTEIAHLELNEEENGILSVLSHEPTHVDRITKLTKLETSTIGAQLSMLEIKGLIKNVGGQNYIRI